MTLGQQRVQALQDVVTLHPAHTGPSPDSRPPASLHQRLGTPPGVHTPGVGDDADALAHAGREDPLHERDEVPGVPGGRIPAPLLLHDGHGDLRQVVHHQVVDGAALHLPDRGLQVVPPEALPGGDSDLLSFSHGSLCQPAFVPCAPPGPGPCRWLGQGGVPSGSWNAPTWGPGL